VYPNKTFSQPNYCCCFRTAKFAPFWIKKDLKNLGVNTDVSNLIGTQFDPCTNLVLAV